MKKRQKLTLSFVFIFLTFFMVCFKNHTKNEHFSVNIKNKTLSLNIKDVLITIKTTNKFHQTRIQYILDTWYQFADTQIYLVTDSSNSSNDLTSLRSKNQVIYSDCKNDHSREALCCKFGHELNLFFTLKQNFKWFCHVDDDNYINIPNLLEFLSKYDSDEHWYIGRKSWTRLVEKPYLKPSSFNFGTFGAGVCLSAATMTRIKNYSNPLAYTKGCLKAQLPDDMFMGYLLEWNYKINLTEIFRFNHHLDINQFKDPKNIHSQITFSFGASKKKQFDKSCNCTIYPQIVPQIATLFKDDPFRVKSLHCLLFPYLEQCKSMFIDAFIKLRDFESN